jgi:hypothetical protein
MINGSTTFTELEALLEREGLVVRSLTRLRRSTGYIAVLESKPEASAIRLGQDTIPQALNDALAVHSATADTIPHALRDALAAARDARRVAVRGGAQ